MDSMETFKKEFQSRKPQFELLGGVVSTLVKQLINSEKNQWDVKHRAKSWESFSKKLSKKQYQSPFTENTDFVGVRIIVNKPSDIRKVARALRKEFIVDPDNSTNKLKRLGQDKFGYRSYHLIVKLTPERSAQRDYQGCPKDQWVEIQIRTRAEDAWAVVTHDSAYKSESEIPPELNRKFNRIAALLELADLELESAFKESRSIFRKAKQTLSPSSPIDVPHLAAHLERSNPLNEIVGRLDKNMVTIVPPAPIGDEVPILHAAGIKTIGQLDAILEATHPWSNKFLGKFFAISTHLYGRGSTPTFADRNTILKLTIMAACSHVLTEEVLGEREYRPPWREMYRTVPENFGTTVDELLKAPPAHRIEN